MIVTERYMWCPALVGPAAEGPPGSTWRGGHYTYYDVFSVSLVA
jgi:hypothetical protein